MSYHDLTILLLRKQDRRTRIGWVDYSSDSYDYRMAMDRASRIIARLNRGAA